MDKILSESNLAGVKWQDFDKVLLVNSAGELNGVEVSLPGRMALFAHPETPAKVSVARGTLRIVVQRPNDLTAMGRVRLTLGLADLVPARNGGTTRPYS
ncbi:MAG: hypothetical protein EON93_04105 [Burkholderiales bacterium]|nr:MAG: hypothetical protein EON93_04105 [Burkholderiales bacterium]